MEIEKEQKIVVRYIPQYIVIETRYKSPQLDAEHQQISKTTSTTKYECDERLDLEHSNPVDPCNAFEYDDDHEANEFADLKQIESFNEKTSGSKQSSPKRKYNIKAAKLLNDWFLSHLHDPYPTEEEKDYLVSATNMTKLQVNYWFINKRKRNKHLLTNSGKTSIDFGLFEDVQNALSDDITSNVVSNKSWR